MRVMTAISLLTLLGCGSFSAPKKDTFYRLQEPAVAAVTTVDASAPIIYVPPFAASGLHGERALVYAHDDGTALEQYTYHFWIDSPRLLLQQALADQLRATSARRIVLEPTADAVYTVYGRIRKFERRAAGKAGAAEVTLEFQVVSAKSAVAEFERIYSRSVALSDDGMATCASALSQSARDILAEFTRDLRTHWGG